MGIVFLSGLLQKTNYLNGPDANTEFWQLLIQERSEKDIAMVHNTKAHENSFIYWHLMDNGITLEPTVSLGSKNYVHGCG